MAPAEAIPVWRITDAGTTHDPFRPAARRSSISRRIDLSDDPGGTTRNASRRVEPPCAAEPLGGGRQPARRALGHLERGARGPTAGPRLQVPVRLARLV